MCRLISWWAGKSICLPCLKGYRVLDQPSPLNLSDAHVVLHLSPPLMAHVLMKTIIYKWAWEWGKLVSYWKKQNKKKKNNREKCLERLSSGPIPSGPYSTHEPEERWEDCKALSLPPGESSPVIGISVKGVPSPCCHMSPSRAVPSCHLSLRQPGRSGPSACACPMQSLGASCRAPHLAWRCTGSCQPQHIAAQMGRKQEQQT